MLNVTTMVLALALLPAPFAITRIVAGFFVTIVVTYLVARAVGRVGSDPQVAIGDEPSRTTGRTAAASGASTFAHSIWDRIRQPRRHRNAIAVVRARGCTPADGIALVLVPALWVWSVARSRDLSGACRRRSAIICRVSCWRRSAARSS